MYWVGGSGVEYDLERDDCGFWSQETHTITTRDRSSEAYEV